MGGFVTDSPGKKIARAWAYAWAREQLTRQGKEYGTVFGLAGPNASDLGPIRAFGIARDPDGVLLADKDGGGLDVATTAWPGVRTFHGAAQDAEAPWPIDLLMLDLCGSVEGANARSILAHLRPRLRRGSMIVITFLKGRDPGSQAMWIRGLRKVRQRGITEMAADVMGVNFGHLTAVETSSWMGQVCRVIAAEDAVRMALGLKKDGTKGVRGQDTVLVPHWHLDYQGQRVPMVMAGFVLSAPYWPKPKKSKTWVSTFVVPAWNGDGDLPEAIAAIRKAALGHVRPSRSDRRWLLGVADRLAAKGIDASAALSVSARTLAAWRAHRTMGSYVREFPAGTDARKREGGVTRAEAQGGRT